MTRDMTIVKGQEEDKAASFALLALAAASGDARMASANHEKRVLQALQLARPRVDLNAVTFTSGQGRTTSQQGRDVRMWCGARTDRSLGTDRLVRRFEGGFGVY